MEFATFPTKCRETMETMKATLMTMSTFLWTSQGLEAAGGAGWQLKWTIASTPDRTRVFLAIWPEPAEALPGGA